MKKLDKPFVITLEHQEEVDLFATMTSAVALKTVMESGANPAEMFKLFMRLDNAASKEIDLIVNLFKGDKEV